MSVTCRLCLLRADVHNSVKNMLVHFTKLYDHDFGTWKDIPSVVSQVKLLDTVAQTAAEYFDTQGVGLKFSRELVDAATRVNYGQSLEHIHGFGGVVSMSADSASTVVTGNRAIFENFIRASGANLLLNTTVRRGARWSMFLPDAHAGCEANQED